MKKIDLREVEKSPQLRPLLPILRGLIQRINALESKTNILEQESRLNEHIRQKHRVEKLKN